MRRYTSESFFFAFGSCILSESLLFCNRPKNVIDAVHSVGNRDQTGSLRGLTINGEGHVGIIMGRPALAHISK